MTAALLLAQLDEGGPHRPGDLKESVRGPLRGLMVDAGRDGSVPRHVGAPGLELDLV